MSWMVAIAKRFLPASERAQRILETFLDFSLEHFDALAERIGEEEARAMYRKAAAAVGRKTGETLKKELKMEPGTDSARDSWVIGCRLLGFRIRTQDAEDGVDFEHLNDPLWESFVQHGRLLCDCTCVPMTRAMARVFYPEANVEFVREPTLAQPCIKRLVFRSEED